MIAEFFENKEIFVTGGSGIVGKTLLEKLLRSCNVGKIHILLRPKKNDSVETRMAKLKDALIFRQLKLQKPDELDKKLVCIPGDAALPLLGITPEHQKLLENVNIVFHCAATVRFDEPLRHALRLNLGGTYQMLKFAETLKHLEVVMHVSTFFSNPYLKRVEDKFYEAPMDWRVCLKLLERTDISDDQLDIITRKLIIGFPNTYCFTKNLAESCVNDHRSKLPLAIYRPSVVISAIAEPEPGFSSSFVGATGIFAVGGAGLLKTVYLRKGNQLDICPQDIAIKTLCFYTFKTADIYKNNKKPEQIPMYMTSSCTHSSMSFDQYIAIGEDYRVMETIPFEKTFLIPGVSGTESRFVYMFLVIFKQLLPALLADFAIVLSGREPLLMRIQRRAFATLEVMKSFLFNYYESPGTTDMDEMLIKLKGTDFNVDVVQTAGSLGSWINTSMDILVSIRANMLKEDPKTLPRSRKIMQAKIMAYKIIKFLLAFKIYGIVMNYFAHALSFSKEGNIEAENVL